MEYLKEFLTNFINLANAMSIYILIGLIIAGFLKEILPKNFISKHLGKSNFLSVIKATLLGIPMPVCSCSVIPLAKSLQKEGASAGAVQSFLISTPITGVDSILATYSFFGWFFTLYRVITSVIIAIIAGTLQNIYSINKQAATKIELQLNSTKNRPFKLTNSTKINFATTLTKECSKGCCTTIDSNDKEDIFSLKRVFKYAFNTLYSDIAKSLFIGLVIGAIFTTFLPKELMATASSNLVVTYLLILLISMPLYVCATSSLPIGASLLLSGLPIGAVFVFLSAGPATNSVTMSIVKDMFGKRGFLVYIFTIAILSILFAIILDTFFAKIDLINYIDATQTYSIINYIASAILLILTAYYWRER